MFTVGFMIFDFITNCFWLKDFTPLGKQYIAHHFIASLIVIMSSISGEHCPKLVVVTLLCEISGIFLMIRDVMGKNSWTGFWSHLNMGLFFVSYTLVRMVMFPFCIYSHIKLSTLYDFDNHTLFHRVSFWVTLILFICIYLLNVFWYSIILRTVSRVLFTSE